MSHTHNDSKFMSHTLFLTLTLQDLSVTSWRNEPTFDRIKSFLILNSRILELKTDLTCAEQPFFI